MDFLEMMRDIGVDVETTLRRFGNNQGLLERFVKKLPGEETYGRLEAAVKEKDYQSVENLAHTLKGVAANLGFQALSDSCNTLVWDVRNGTTEEVPEHFRGIEREYQLVLDGIKKLSD